MIYPTDGLPKESLDSRRFKNSHRETWLNLQHATSYRMRLLLAAEVSIRVKVVLVRCVEGVLLIESAPMRDKHSRMWSQLQSR
jgi:hypothetical protein